MARAIITGVRVSSKGETTYVDVHYVDDELGNGGVTGFITGKCKAPATTAILLSEHIAKHGACAAEIEWGFDMFGGKAYPKMKSAKILSGVTFQLTPQGVRYSDQKAA